MELATKLINEDFSYRHNN